MTKKKQAKNQVESNDYTVVLDTVGNTYKTTGENVNDAITSLGLSWDKIKGKGVITISKGSKTYEHLFYLPQLRRIFANKLTRLMWSKRLEHLLSLQ